MPDDHKPELMTIPAAARYLSISVGTLRRLMRSGDLRHCLVSPRNVRIARRELDEHIELNTKK